MQRRLYVQLATIAIGLCCFHAAATLQTASHFHIDCNDLSGPTFSDIVNGFTTPFETDITIEIRGTCTPATNPRHRLDLHGLLARRASPAHHVTIRGGTHTGGVKLDINRWVATKLNGLNLYSYNLSEFNIKDYGTIHSGGLGNCVQTKLELFADGFPMTLARYPNVNSSSISEYNGPWMDWAFVGEDPDAKNHPNSFVTSDEMAVKFISANQNGNRAWVHGFWKFGWADNFIEVVNTTVTNPTECNQSPEKCLFRVFYNPKTQPLYGEILHRAKFYAVNSPDLLDVPGEYWIDETAQVLYYLPASDDALKTAYLNVMMTPVVEIPTGSANITLESLLVTYGRTVGMTGKELTDVRLNNVQSSNMGQAGVEFSGLKNCLFTYVSTLDTGCMGGGWFGSGDTKTLEMANVMVANGNFGRYSRWTRTYQAGIKFSGVGLTFENNTVHDAPHQGMTGGGNNLLFKANRFLRLCWEVTDSGAFYIGRSWVHRGNVLLNNYFEDIVHLEPYHLGSPSVQAIYLDDEQSGVQVIGNTIVNAMTGILVGGGRDNYVGGNHFSQIQDYAVRFDNRGMNWQKMFCFHNATYSGELVEQLFSVNYKNPPYSVEYPQLPPTLARHPCVPVNNTFESNLVTNCIAGYQGFIDRTSAEISSWYSVLGKNNTSC